MSHTPATQLLFRRKRKEGESVCDRFVGEDIFYIRFPPIEPKKYKMVVPYGLRYPPPPFHRQIKLEGVDWVRWEGHEIPGVPTIELKRWQIR
jgi:hypothetical protein